MHVRVNGVRLFFDVEGAKLVPDGPAMREKPTLILLHGAPGLTDHSGFKPAFGRLAEIAQLVYLDVRGAGRSEAGPPERWGLEQWADDLVAFCEALGIEKPAVLGVSGGGFVAMAYATRHPEHPSKLVLASTQARLDVERTLRAFERLGGERARDAASDFLARNVDRESSLGYAEVCLPLYNRTPRDDDAPRRAVFRADLFGAFHQTPTGIWHTFDLRKDLRRIRCPTLVLAGDADPITPIEDSEEIAAAIDPRLVRFERFEDCGHGVWQDDPGRAFALIEEFLT
jgi:proline iminopeptidase